MVLQEFLLENLHAAIDTAKQKLKKISEKLSELHSSCTYNLSHVETQKIPYINNSECLLSVIIK